jgi:hypothetical protein
MSADVTNLSQNFTLEELTFSQVAARKGIDNTPSPESIENLGKLCSVLLEPIRALLGVPLHVDSGYRSQEVNAAVGGASNSAHLEGRAADIIPLGMSLEEAFDKIRGSDLPFDQVIGECGPAWIHVAIADNPRRQALTCWGSPGHWHYVEA